jgi:hypothetical protein
MEKIDFKVHNAPPLEAALNVAGENNTWGNRIYTF